MTRAVLSSVLFVVLLAACLFVPARQLDWPMAWAVVAYFAVYSALGLLLLSPDLIEERSRLPRDAEAADLALAGLALVFLLPVSLVVCGLDARGGGPRAAGLVEGLAFLVFAVGYAFGLWAARVNPFFSAAVRIQTERGHHVIDRGPYAWLRHPGYAGPIASHLALPFALGARAHCCRRRSAPSCSRCGPCTRSAVCCASCPATPTTRLACATASCPACSNERR